MLSLARNNPLSFTDPEPIVRVTNLGDNSVDLTLNVWSTNDDWWSMQCHVKGLDQMINQMGQAQKLPTTKD